MEHYPYHSDLNHGFTNISPIFIIFAEPAMLIQPCESSFDNPAAGKKKEAFGSLGTCNDFQCPSEMFPDPFNNASGISAIRNNCFQSGKSVENSRQQKLYTVSVLNISAVNNDCYYQAENICQNMTFSPVNLFAAVKTVFTAPFRDFDRLAVNDSDTWFRVTPCLNTGFTKQSVMDAFPYTLFFSFSEIPVNGLPRRQVMRQ